MKRNIMVNIYTRVKLLILNKRNDLHGLLEYLMELGNWTEPQELMEQLGSVLAVH